MKKLRIPAKLRAALKRQNTQPIRMRAVLGKSDGTIAGDQENFVWVTDANDDETQVFNDAIPANKYGYGLPIWIERIEGSTLWRITSIRQIYGAAPVAVGIREHASTHSAVGNDPVWVWSDQFMPWLVAPSGLTLKVYRMSFWNGTAWEDAVTETLDLTSHKPASGARYILLEVKADGDLVVTDGTVIAGSKFELTIADIPDPTVGRQSLCGVRLYAGQTVIAKNGVNRDIYDLRFSRAFSGGAGGGVPGGADTQVQYNDGGVLAGDADFTWDKVNNFLKIATKMRFEPHGLAYVSGQAPLLYLDDYLIQFFFDEGGAQFKLGNGTDSSDGFFLQGQNAGYGVNLSTANLTGAHKDIDFPDDSGELVVQDTDHLDFDTTPTGAGAVGRLIWNEDEETLDLGMPNDITQQIGHELFFSVKNSTGATITDGTPVMFAGTDGNSGHVLIQKAIADGTLRDEMTVGLMTHDIENGDFGKATWFGKVRGIDTTGDPYSETWADGDLIWVSQTTAGYLSNVEPATGQKILIAAVVHAHSNGTLLVRPSWGNYVPRSQQQDTQDPTGWVDNTDIAVSYDVSTRKITLTGTLDYYWQGVKKSLSSPWVSDAHSSDDGRYFLYTEDGVTFAWSTTPWNFYDLMVAIARKYSTSPAYQFGLLEVHGLMPWQTHRELHETISAYRVSGGGLTAGTYTENTASDAATTPGFDSMVMADEDIETTIAAWTQGTYTTLRIGASNYPSFDVAASFPFRSSGSYILVNNPATGAETAAGNNQYVNIYILRLPTTSDADSQKYRLVCLQPQRTFTSLAAAQAEDTRSLSLGDLVPSVPEIVFYERITYVLASGDGNTGKCRIATGGISYIYGSRMSQISAPGYANPTAENVIFTPAGSIAAVNVQAAIEELDTEKAPLASPALTGDPTAPTATAGDNDTSIATTAFVQVEATQRATPIGLMNGKLSVTVASNNLTVAVKTLAGADPSASDPVRIQIDGAIRTITAALSVTKNAGTNWMDAGGTKFATKEIDYFAYIGYNATDGVVLGFSRIPYACQYSDFSATSTAITYAAISTITNAAAANPYVVVGRFAATLSAGAGYTWTVPTYTPTNLIQYPIWETRQLTWVPAVTSLTGSITTVGTVTATYMLRQRQEFLVCSITITTNGTGATAVVATHPFTVPDQFIGAREFTTGFLCYAVTQSGNVYLRKYDETYPGASGAIIKFSGWLNLS